jgi:hypothetical protein
MTDPRFLFQTVTICNGFIPLVGQALFHDAPIDLRIFAAGQDGDDIDDGEIPPLLDLVSGAADLFFFKEGEGAHGVPGSIRRSCRQECLHHSPWLFTQLSVPLSLGPDRFSAY